MKYFYLILFLFISLFSCKSQTEYSFKEFVHTINTGLIKSNAVGRIIEKKYEEGELINSEFLGSVTDELGNVFHVVNMIHIIINKNKNRTHENFVMIYSGSEFKGHYYLLTTNQLPNKIEGNFLIFSKACNTDIIKLSFKNGIPSVLRLSCNNKPDDCEFIKNERT
jgi:hypothetical protein